MMEEEEEMEVVLVFEAREIDVDYEFQAPMFFDFTREESFPEAREAERWFDTAQTYPPSPFVAKLVLREESLLESVKNNASSAKCKEEEGAAALLDHHSNPALQIENREHEGIYRGITTDVYGGHVQKASNQPLESARGFAFYHPMSTDKSKPKLKSHIKPNFPRTSTLMKPTASQLAKQNQLPQVVGSRFQALPGQKENSSVVESQAAKRQKLERGHLPKVGDIKHQNDFMHKVPKKDGIVDTSFAPTRLRLTIPREPDLETAHRAQRIRAKDSTEVDTVMVVTRRFKARPLNRKILEAPLLPLPKKSTPKLPEFQEFHLKTSERAMQHTSAVSSSSHPCNDTVKGLEKTSAVSVAEFGKREPRRPFNIESSKQEGCSTAHIFKAHPLNKKIFSSKGDMGVFRNSKRETTVPMEFNLHTEKRVQHNPPVELFSKLSLTSELQQNNGSHLQLPQSSFISLKGSKENRLTPLQTEHKVTHLAKERLSLFGGKQIQCGSNECMNEVGKQLSMRSFGIW